jgi:hypothetical protein
MTGQLSLFKGKRQRGTRAPPAKEFALQCAVADAIRRWKLTGWRYTHIPLGELRNKVTAARLKRMGTVAGWPDFIFMHLSGRVCFLEMKRRGNRLTDEQEELAEFLRAAGHSFEVADGFRDAIEILKGWGVVRAGVEVQ